MPQELLEYEILRLQNGSKLYGTDTAESDDDYIGVFVEPPEYVFSLKQAKTINLHDRAPGEPNGPGEVDGSAYGLRHFFSLTANGNPTLLALLYARPHHIIKDVDGLGLYILDHRDLFLSARAGRRFQKYMEAQLMRLKGEKKGHTPNRAEIREKYGYDTKYAMQIARLAIQGVEFLSDHFISCPMTEENRELCLAIRHGAYSYEEVLDVLEDLSRRVEEAYENTTLPPNPDELNIHRLSQTIHERAWRKWL